MRWMFVIGFIAVWLGFVTRADRLRKLGRAI